MGHDHDHTPANYNLAFVLGITLNLVFVALEAMVGVLGHSLALIADAGHNLSDVLSLLLAWGAIHLARRPPTVRRTYGLRRSTILAALANAMILLVAIGAIGWEAIQRLNEPAPVSGVLVMWVAGIGIVINTATALMFLSVRQRDVNIEGAFLHMAADAGVSLGVLASGAVIFFTGWLWVDSPTSLIVATVIAIATWGLLRKSIRLAMDFVPEHIDPVAVTEYLASLPGVTAVHDLHIWGMSTTETALTAHLVMPEIDNADDLLARAAEDLHERFGIEHTTLQIERKANRCRLVPDGVV